MHKYHKNLPQMRCGAQCYVSIETLSSNKQSAGIRIFLQYLYFKKLKLLISKIYKMFKFSLRLAYKYIVYQ